MEGCFWQIQAYKIEPFAPKTRLVHKKFEPCVQNANRMYAKYETYGQKSETRPKNTNPSNKFTEMTKNVNHSTLRNQKYEPYIQKTKRSNTKYEPCVQKFKTKPKSTNPIDKSPKSPTIRTIRP